MKIWTRILVTVFHITQFQARNSENVLSDSNNDCSQTKVLQTRRHALRKYPPGTALYLDGKCLCGGGFHEITDVPFFQSHNEAISDGFKSKMIESPEPDNRVIGNYGSFVFAANVQMLNFVLTAKREDKYLCCNCVEPSALSNRIRYATTNQTKRPNGTSESNRRRSNNAVEENIKYPLIPLNGRKTVLRTSKSPTENEEEILSSKNRKNKNKPMENLTNSKRNKTHCRAIIIVDLLLLIRNGAKEQMTINMIND